MSSATRNPFTNTSKKRAKKQEFETLPSKKEDPRAVQGGLGRRPILKNRPLAPRKTFDNHMQRIFIFDPTRCFGCNGCTAACTNINQTPNGLSWRTVHKLPPHDGDHRTIYLSISCNHCENPPCVKACPANALEKRNSDGVVIHYPEKCLGCRYCQMACPYDAIKWEEATGIVSKCHFCHERLAVGREPACVETCFAGALKQKLIIFDDLSNEYRKEIIGFKHIKSIGPALRFSESLTVMSSEDQEEVKIKRGQ